ncbi:hypothetical protein BDW22DRAFT_1344035 [Trametopsis cervina]|nr:hypothetical protein BDW22DRAFT_1344035 [Trametopsis cervina]
MSKAELAALIGHDNESSTDALLIHTAVQGAQRLRVGVVGHESCSEGRCGWPRLTCIRLAMGGGLQKATLGVLSFVASQMRGSWSSVCAGRNVMGVLSRREESQEGKREESPRSSVAMYLLAVAHATLCEFCSEALEGVPASSTPSNFKEPPQAAGVLFDAVPCTSWDVRPSSAVVGKLYRLCMGKAHRHKFDHACVIEDVTWRSTLAGGAAVARRLEDTAIERVKHPTLGVGWNMRAEVGEGAQTNNATPLLVLAASEAHSWSGFPEWHVQDGLLAYLHGKERTSRSLLPTCAKHWLYKTGIAELQQHDTASGLLHATRTHLDRPDGRPVRTYIFIREHGSERPYSNLVQARSV